MQRKSKPKSDERKWDDVEQSQRFLDAAKEAEASDDPKDFERALKKIAPHRLESKKSS